MRLLSQEEAYSDWQGQTDLSKYREERCVRVSTTDEAYVIAVEQTEHSCFQVYLLHEHTPVGVIYMTLELRNLYSLSSYFLKKYRGRGLAKMLYKWLLDSGFSLTTDDGQSRYSYRLWKSLSKEYELLVVRFSDDIIIYHGEKARKRMCTKWSTNVLLRRGLTPQQFASDCMLDIE